MQQINCPHCNTEFDEKEVKMRFHGFYPICPHCGKYIKFKNKNYIILRAVIEFLVISPFVIFSVFYDDINRWLRLLVFIIGTIICFCIDRIFFWGMIKEHRVKKTGNGEI